MLASAYLNFNNIEKCLNLSDKYYILFLFFRINGVFDDMVIYFLYICKVKSITFIYNVS